MAQRFIDKSKPTRVEIIEPKDQSAQRIEEWIDNLPDSFSTNKL